ncbi:lymphocyte antigen 6 complex locus protein G6d-like [Oscarella lobularis]|uniref:lymphocyte antigen 6 complex locus protein G6d-like n=1 Tax=Oscarella lobularis TaxID=121494 RepID=UPI003313413E
MRDARSVQTLAIHRIVVAATILLGFAGRAASGPSRCYACAGRADCDATQTIVNCTSGDVCWTEHYATPSFDDEARSTTTTKATTIVTQRKGCVAKVDCQPIPTTCANDICFSESCCETDLCNSGVATPTASAYGVLGIAGSVLLIQVRLL